MEDDYRRIRLWRREGAFHSYFAETVRNVARNFLRQRGGTDAREVQHDQRDREFDPPDPGPDPERLTLLGEIRNLLSGCIQRLDEQARRVFQLRHFEDRSYAQIATETRLGIGHVGVMLTRAERQVRDCLTRRLGESPAGVLI